MLHEERERQKCSDQAHSIPFDMIRKMLSQDPEERPTAHTTHHPPPASHDEEEYQALGLTLTSCARKDLSTAENSDLATARSGSTSGPKSGSLGKEYNGISLGDYEPRIKVHCWKLVLRPYRWTNQHNSTSASLRGITTAS